MGCSTGRPKQAPQFALMRMSQCGICEHNAGGVCSLVKEMQKNKEALIEIGVMKPEAWCPIGKWGQHKTIPLNPGERRKCYWCNRYHDTEHDVCPWCRAKMKMELRNTRKNIGGRGFGDPFDIRLHEIKPQPFTGDVKRNLHYFLYPRFDESTAYHLRKLRETGDLFNGKRVCCVATDANTLHEKYREEIESFFTKVYYRNNRSDLRELVGFIDSLSHLVTDDPNSVICFAHAKGQQPHTYNNETVRRWTDVMYETCVNNWEGVNKAFEDGHPITGVFKSIGAFRGTEYKWHYSGAFWWARSSAIDENPKWRMTCNRWWGSESYVGKHWYPDESHCLFGEGTGNGSLYKAETWNRVEIELEQWRESQRIVA